MHDPAIVEDVRAWLAKAAADLRAGEVDLAASPPLLEDVLFHCQQAAEKALKAFLAWRDEFEFAPAAQDVMETFNALRAEHEKPAAKAMNEARAAFQQGNKDQGYAKYQEIVDKYFAASSYRNAKRWLAERQ